MSGRASADEKAEGDGASGVAWNVLNDSRNFCRDAATNETPNKDKAIVMMCLLTVNITVQRRIQRVKIFFGEGGLGAKTNTVFPRVLINFHPSFFMLHYL